MRLVEISDAAGVAEAPLAGYERSGMTGAQFARFSGVRCDVDVLAAEAAQGSWRGEEPVLQARGLTALGLEARVEGEGPKTENIVVEMGGGIRMLVGNRTQAARRGELLRAMGLAGDVEFFGKPAGVRGGGGVRHAERVRGTFGVGGSAPKEEVKSGALFAFSNRRRTRLKTIWGRKWLMEMSKRLEKGTFAWPKPGEHPRGA